MIVGEREGLLRQFRETVGAHDQANERLRQLRQEYAQVNARIERSEAKMQTLQSVGQLIGELVKVCENDHFIVKTSSGPTYLVGARRSIPRALLKDGARVALELSTMTVMRVLPREVDPTLFQMLAEDPGNVSYSSIGGLAEQLGRVREVIELPLTNPELFKRVGIKPPSGVLLYGPPGTGKTLIARALAKQIDANFLKIVASSIMEKYIGGSARLIREIFSYAREHQPCIVFIDEIDALGGRRFSSGTSADREIQRTLMQLLAELDGFDALGKVKVVMATNRPDTLDPALLRAGRLDRKIEIPLPNEQARYEILKIHSKHMNLAAGVDFDPVVKMSDGFNGADLRNVCTEAGMSAIREKRDVVVQEDFLHAGRQLMQAKRLETKLEYKPM